MDNMGRRDPVIVDMPNRGATGTLTVQLTHNREFIIPNVGADMLTAADKALMNNMGVRFETVDGTRIGAPVGTVVDYRWVPDTAVGG